MANKVKEVEKLWCSKGIAAEKEFLELFKKGDVQTKKRILELIGKKEMTITAEGIKDKDENIRALAVDCLSSFDDKVVVPTLLKATEDGSKKVRDAAIKALDKLVGYSKVMPLIEWTIKKELKRRD